MKCSIIQHAFFENNIYHEKRKRFCRKKWKKYIKKFTIKKII